MNTYFNFINKETKKIDTRLGGRHCFTTKTRLLKSTIHNILTIENKTKDIISEAISEYEITNEIFKIIENQLQLVLVELSHQLPHNNIKFMFVLPSRTDAMLAQTTGVPPVGRWLPKVVEVISDHVDGDFRYIMVYFDANSFGVTVAKVNEKTGFVDWCCPEYKNHPQVFEYISNL